MTHFTVKVEFGRELRRLSPEALEVMNEIHNAVKEGTAITLLASPEIIESSQYKIKTCYDVRANQSRFQEQVSLCNSLRMKDNKSETLRLMKRALFCHVIKK